MFFRLPSYWQIGLKLILNYLEILKDFWKD